MYQNFFGLHTEPFTIAPNPRFLYMSDQHHEALAHLIYGVSSSGGFILLTGEVGTGKTTVCRAFLEQLPDGCDIAFIFNPKLSVRELLSTVCDEFGVSADGISQKEYIDALNRYLLESHSRGRKAVLIIDEAQNLSASVLEQLRLLTNLETNDSKLLQIVLLGQPELKTLFEREELRQLAQRVTARYHLNPLSLQETSAYIAHRLSVAGRSDMLLDQKAVRRVHRLSGGVPRLINLLCDRSLLGAYSRGQREVDVHTVNHAAQEVLGTSNRFSLTNLSLLAGRPYVTNLLMGLSVVTFVVLLSSLFYPLLFDSSQERQVVNVYSDKPANPVYVTRSVGVGQRGDDVDTDEAYGRLGMDSAKYHATETKLDTADAILNQDMSQLDLLIEEALEDLSRKDGSANVEAAEYAHSSIFEQKGADQKGLQSSFSEWGMAADGDNKLEAYSALLKLWGLNDKQWRSLREEERTHERFCILASDRGMGCEVQQDSLEGLELLNRPAVISLVFAESGTIREVEVALIELTEREARVQFKDQEARFTRAALSAMWGGQYTVLWKRPPVYHGNIVVGAVGPEIRFLSKQLGKLQNDPALSQGILMYDEAFREKVRQFQVSMGLVPDGVVGMRTWMKLNAESGAHVPILAKKAKIVD